MKHNLYFVSLLAFLTLFFQYFEKESKSILSNYYVNYRSFSGDPANDQSELFENQLSLFKMCPFAKFSLALMFF